MTQKFELQEFLPFRLNRLASEMSNRLSQVYREKFGIDVTEWRVIATLAQGGEITAQSIVASTRTHKSSISRAVTKLMNMGWIERSNSRADGREKSLQLTLLGRNRLEEILPLVLAYEKQVLDTLAQNREDCLQTIHLLEEAIIR